MGCSYMPMSKEAYRRCVVGCTFCVKRKPEYIFKSETNTVINTPRYGTGNRDHAPLMLIGQNPPQDPVRGLHGAWMLHYTGPGWDEKKGPHELLVLDLVTHLGLTIQDVWATQAVKCPTEGNERPSYFLTRNCQQQFLENEVREVDPKVIIAFGSLAQVALSDCFDRRKCRPENQERQERFAVSTGYWARRWTIKGVGSSPAQEVHQYTNIVYAPHPSTVGRFIDKFSWRDAIKQAYLMAQGERRMDTTYEIEYRRIHG